MSLELTSVSEMPQVGLNLSTDPAALQQGEYTYMLNGCLSDVTGKESFARMYKGNRFICLLPVGYHLIGNCNVAQQEVCVMLVNPSTGHSEIGLFDGRSYRAVAGSFRLGFRIDKQIQVVVEEDYNGGKIAIWVDNHNNVRLMDLNNPPILNGELDVDALNLFKTYSYPQATVQDVVTGGRLLSGSYYISLQYADENGNGLTSCSTPVGPIYIYRDNLNQPRQSINGSVDREPTGKAIRFGLSNIDQSFKYLNIVIIRSFEGIRSSVIATTIPTSQSTYLYAGLADLESDISLDTVLTPGVSYRTAKTVALSNGTCLLGNLRGNKDYNLQPFISQIAVLWQLTKVKYDTSADSYANPLNGVYEMQFRRNELYDLGVAIRWTDGSKSRVYPLISRKKNMTATGLQITKTTDQYNTPITNGWDTTKALSNDDLADPTAALPERWQQESTAFVTGTDLLNPAGEGPAQYGEFGYNEELDEYPLDANVWGSNAGQPIRRFRMPDISVAPIIDGENEFRGDSTDQHIYKLGLRFVNIEEVMNSLPAEVKARMAGYELVRADRRNNRSVIGSGLLFNMWIQNWSNGGVPNDPINQLLFFKYRQQDDIRLYPNYPLNDLNPDKLILKQSLFTDSKQDILDLDRLKPGNDRYRKDVFTFVSPDTSFQTNLLFSSKLLIHKEVYGVGKATTSFLDPYPSLIDKGNNQAPSAYQSVIVGTYNNWKKTIPGQLQRQVNEAIYIPFNAQVASGAIGIPVQNVMRESTVLVGLTKPISDPTIIDTSRSTIDDVDFKCSITKSPLTRTVSAMYATLMAPIGSQYGNVFDPRYCFTNYDNVNIRNGVPIYGGDSYIAPFAIKRQMVFYQNAQAFKDVPDGELGIDLRNSDTINRTKYYYEAARKNARKDSFTQCEDGGAVNKMPVINSGIAYFFVESDYNIDLRGNGDAEHETFYPNLKDGSLRLDKFMGIEHVDKDNDYRINASYSEINDLTAYQTPDPFYDPLLKDVDTHYSTRTIFSLHGTPENRFNNLQVFLPLNYHDFPRDSGELTDIRDVGNNEILFRLEHALYSHRLYAQMATSEGNINLGSGKMFESAPTRISKSDDGYTGSNEQWAFNNTPFGANFTDALRNCIFNFTGKANDIAARHIDNWTNENMSFNLLRDIPGFVNIDNPANPEGIGFHSIYDTENKLWILTKRDYELIDPTTAGRFTVNDGILYLNNGPVSLKDPMVFRNKSWTIMYDCKRQRWVGWASFTPTAYFQMNKKYYSFQDGKIWCHDNPVPRTYYGIRQPFAIETVLKTPGTFVTFTSSFTTRLFPIVNNILQGESFEETFTHGFIHNDYQCTGMYALTVQDENNLSTLIRDPIITATSQEKFLRKLNASWNIDEIHDMVADHSKPFFHPGWQRDIDHSNIDYQRDYKEAAVLRDVYSKHRYIYDREKDVQMYLYLMQAVSQISMK